MRQAVVCHHREALRKRFGSLTCTTLKAPYDPSNLFHVNQYIKPTR